MVEVDNSKFPVRLVGATLPGLASEMDETSPATQEQLGSIRMLYQGLGKPVPDTSALTFFGARKVIRQLTTEYKEARQKRTS